MRRRKDTGSHGNGMMFYQAWLDIRNKKLTADSDWVVKVDGDAVFLPQRLLDTLKGYKAPAGGVYIENCKKVMFGFFGHLEVVSTDGFNTFLSSLETCKSTLDWKGLDPDWKYGPYGEDLFMQKCMDKVGVSKVSNFTITTNGACKADLPKGCRRRRASSGRLTAQARSQLCCIPSRSLSITSRASQRRSARMKQIAGGALTVTARLPSALSRW